MLLVEETRLYLLKGSICDTKVNNKGTMLKTDIALKMTLLKNKHCSDAV